MALSKWDEVGDIMIENDDIKIIAGVAPEYPFGLHYDFGSFPAYFIGRPKYTYGTNCYLNEQCDDANSYTTDTCSTNEWWVFRQRLFAQLYQRSFSYNNGLTQPPSLSLSACSQNPVGSNANVCGNDVCEPAVGESCTSCPQDCYIPVHCNILGLGMSLNGKAVYLSLRLPFTTYQLMKFASLLHL